MFKTSKIIDEFNMLAPEILNTCRSSLTTAKKDLDFLRLDEKFFSKCSNISLDNAIMEKTNKGVVIKKININETGSIEFEVPLLENQKKNKNDLIFFVLLITYILIFRLNLTK